MQQGLHAVIRVDQYFGPHDDDGAIHYLHKFGVIRTVFTAGVGSIPALEKCSCDQAGCMFTKMNVFNKSCSSREPILKGCIGYAAFIKTVYHLYLAAVDVARPLRWRVDASFKLRIPISLARR